MKTDLSKDSRALLLLIFLISVAAKALVSLKFQGPYIFQDEVVYAKLAENIFGSAYSWTPQFYPFILSIAYIFSKDQPAAYHIMLLVNCVLSSLALFPSYFILRRYCSNNYSLASSIAIVTLPSLVIYNFAVMTENLFIPLVLFSLWFTIEAYESKRLLWIVLSVASVLLLFLTRHNGVIMAFGLLLSFIYYESEGISLRNNTYKTNKKEIALSIGLLLALAAATYIIRSTESNLYYFMQGEINYINQYISTTIGIFSNASSLVSFLSLFANEVEYLVMSTYFVFSFIMAALILSLFYRSRQADGPSGWFELSDLRSDRALKSALIYFLASGFALVFAVAASMYMAISTMPEGYDYAQMTNRADMELLGRYVDPLVPAIFLFGLIGLDRMRLARDEHKLKIISAIAAAFLLLSVVFAVGFPYYASKGPDILTINYTKYMAEVIPLWAIVPLASAIFFICLYLRMTDDKFKYLLVAFIILFSVTSTALTIERTTLPASAFFTSHNSIGTYLEAHSNSSTMVLMDSDDNKRDRIMMPLTSFWSHANFIFYSTPEDASGVYTDQARNASYILTSKILPYEPVAYSTRGYLLYKPTRTKDNGSIYGFDKTQGWNDMELWDNVPTSWMTNNATLTMYSSRDLPAIMSFNVLSFYRPRDLQISYGDALTTLKSVPTSFVRVNMPIDLKQGSNRVRLYVPEGCSRPSDIPDLGAPFDRRCLGAAVQNLSICERIGNESLPLISNSSSHPKAI